MRRFRFRLQRVLKVTRDREEVKRQFLGQALRELAEEEAMLAEVSHRLRWGLEQARDHREGTPRAGELWWNNRYLDRLEREVLHQQGCVEEQAGRADRCRLELLEVSKEKKVLEKLRGKQFRLYQAKSLQDEHKGLDELATQGFVRRRGRDEGSGDGE